VRPASYISEQDGSAQIAVSLKPRGGRDAIEEARMDALVVRVSAPPLEGQANAALCRLLAKAVKIAPSRVTVVRGQTARKKLVRLEGLGASEAEGRLASWLAANRPAR
jgi:uncharacterized protein